MGIPEPRQFGQPHPIDPLPQLRQAPLQYTLRRFEDFICWTQPLFPLLDCEPLEQRRQHRSQHRSLTFGAITLSRNDYGTGVRLCAAVEDRLLFAFNGGGSACFRVDRQEQAPPPRSGILMVTPTEGAYVRSPGAGLLLTIRPEALLQTALAIQGPLAAKRLRSRLLEPLQFFPYGDGVEPSLPGSLLQSLHLVDSLLSPQGTLHAALRLDDLICRQLVLMLCPELMAAQDGAAPTPSSASFELLLEWISSRIGEPLSLSELEARSGYSRRALQRAFQVRFGCGPMQWLRRRRLDLALELLTRASAADSVASIARRCGYLHLASFSRDFSRVYRCRPSDILRANQPQPLA